MTIHAQVAHARQRLRDAGISHIESDLDARLLAQHVLGWTPERFFTDGHTPEPDGFHPSYDLLVARRAIESARAAADQAGAEARAAHVGYHLIGPGRRPLEAELAYRAPVGKRRISS